MSDVFHRTANGQREKRSGSPRRDELVYVADSEKDAEALYFETGLRVEVRRRIVEGALQGIGDLYVTRSFARRDAQDVSDV